MRINDSFDLPNIIQINNKPFMHVEDFKKELDTIISMLRRNIGMATSNPPP